MPYISEQSSDANNTEDESQGADLVRPISQKSPHTNDDGDGSEESAIARLAQNLKHLIRPYTQLHRTCEATAPMMRIYHALSSRTLTIISIMSLIHDALEALRPLRDYQVVNITKLDTCTAVEPRIPFFVRLHPRCGHELSDEHDEQVRC